MGQRGSSSSVPLGHAKSYKRYDTDFWHYMPRWFSPPSIIAAGVGFFVVAMIFDDEHPLKTAIIAAGPLVLFWMVLLYALPRQFKGYVKEHLPEHLSD